VSGLVLGASAARAEFGDRSRLGRRALPVLLGALLVCFLASLMTGPVPLSIRAVIAGLFATDGTASIRDIAIVRDIRLPRTVLAVLVGSALAVSGAFMQGLFRNPLADPGLAGVSAGASLAAVTTIVLGHYWIGHMPDLLQPYALAIAAFGGGLVSTLMLYAIATRNGTTSVATLLLGGIALAALAGAAVGVLVFISDDQQLRDLTFWNLGSVGGADWTKILAVGPIILILLALAPLSADGLNALALGEAEARHLGVSTQWLKRGAILLVAGLTGAAVAVSGTIGFIGIVAPHMLRLIIGPDHRYLIPASACLGAMLLLLADMVARTIVSPAELPIGIVTALIGAPVFLWILLRRRALVDL
jgi:iron complex transport system permease protein